MSEPQNERRPEGERDDQPTSTAPDGTAPDGTAPDGTAPDGTAPDGIVNDSTEDTRVIETEQPTAEQPTTAYGQVPAPGRPSGPHLPPILLGLACLVIAGLAMAQELGHLRVDWGDVGPLGIVAAGAVLVLLGLVGLLTSRRRES